MKYFYVSVKTSAGMMVNFWMFHSAVKFNYQYEKKLKELPLNEFQKIQKMTSALMNNSFFQSESPLLRAMAIAAYQQDFTESDYCESSIPPKEGASQNFKKDPQCSYLSFKKENL